jgi:DNA-binding GntR family transcriptional regulator
VRLVLEPEAVRLATPAHDRDTLRKCELALIDAERLAHDEDLAELCLANRRFHGSLYAPGPNQLLRAMLDDIQDQVAIVSVSTWRRRSTWGVEAEEHRAIFEAVAGRDGELASELLPGHIGKFLARVIENAPREATTKEESG